MPRGARCPGQTVEAFWNSVRHAEPTVVGLNCALGAKQLRPYVEELSRIADVAVCAYPNAGLPNAFGEYDEQACETAALVREFAQEGLVNIVGGCCGTTADHIAHIREAVAPLPPRVPPRHPRRCRLAGLEPLDIGPESLFVNVGERTNVTGSAKFRRLIEADDYNAALDIARSQVDQRRADHRRQHGRGHARLGGRDGALPESDRLRAGHRARAGDARLVQVVGDRGRAQVPAGQGHRQFDQPEGGRGSSSCEHARLVRAYGAAVVVMAFDEQGQADSVERKVADLRALRTGC